MNTDTVLHIGAIAYGVLLIGSVLVRTSLTEALRVDTLFLPGASDATRPLNAVVGALFAGYALWALIRT